MSLPLFKRNICQLWKPLLLFIGILAMYFGVIIYMYDPELSDILTNYQEALPEMMSAVGMTGAATNILEFMKIYLYGFLMLLFPFIYILVIGNHFVMRYVDSGSMACLLASPNSRLKVITTQAFSLILGCVILISVTTGIGYAFCENMFPDKLNVTRYLALNGSLLLLQLAITGMIFFAGCLFNESKHFYLLGAGLPLLFFLFQMMANMGDKMKTLKYFTLYSLFRADEIIAGTSGVWTYNLALALIAIALFGSGIRIFCRKDLCL